MILHNVMWESRPLPKIARKAPAASSAGAFFISSFPFVPLSLPRGRSFLARAFLCLLRRFFLPVALVLLPPFLVLPLPSCKRHVLSVAGLWLGTAFGLGRRSSLGRIDSLFLSLLSDGCCPASGRGSLRGSRQGIRGLRSP